MNVLIADYPAEVQKILGKYPSDQKRSAVMPLLYLAQNKLGYLTKESMEDVSEITGMQVTEVASIVGYYTLFHDRPGGRYRLQVCTDLSCAMRGAEGFLQKMCTNLGIRLGETTADGLITIEEVTCLAGCDHAPMFQVQGDGEIVYHENMTEVKAMALVNTLRAAGKEAGA
jgi:NADH-quinone oxidoreductase subunit E